MSDIIQTLGVKIKYYRLLRKISQAELAARAGISAEYLSRIERGKQVPSLQILILIAEKLEIDVSVLLEKDKI